MVPRIGTTGEATGTVGLEHVARLLLLALVLCPVPGCGKRLAEVHGRVTFRGEPVSGGASVLFENAEAGTYIVARLDEDGRYRVEMAEGYGLPPGTYAVSMRPPDLKPDFPSIPMKYRNPKTSGLTLELTPQGATFDIDMQPGP
jgi:hypothetical protein